MLWNEDSQWPGSTKCLVMTRCGRLPLISSTSGRRLLLSKEPVSSRRNIEMPISAVLFEVVQRPAGDWSSEWLLALPPSCTHTKASPRCQDASLDARGYTPQTRAKRVASFHDLFAYRTACQGTVCGQQVQQVASPFIPVSDIRFGAVDSLARPSTHTKYMLLSRTTAAVKLPRTREMVVIHLRAASSGPRLDCIPRTWLRILSLR